MSEIFMRKNKFFVSVLLLISTNIIMGSQQGGSNQQDGLVRKGSSNDQSRMKGLVDLAARLREEYAFNSSKDDKKSVIKVTITHSKNAKLNNSEKESEAKK
jgi:hypothetical protein